jgi:hypothetical protein
MRILVAAALLLAPGWCSPAADMRPAALLEELSQFTYTANRAIPASDNIFIEEGRVVEELFEIEKEKFGTAVAAGETTSVSKVTVMYRAVHVFFAADRCALLIIPPHGQLTADMSVQQLLQVARKGMEALFVVKSEKRPRRTT